MRCHLPLLCCLPVMILTGCIEPLEKPPALTAEPPRSSTLSIYDAAQNLLTEEDIPRRGSEAFDIVIRDGRQEDAPGVFIKFNKTIRFVSWVDLSASPLGFQMFSDSFVQAGELTLRVTRAPCGGRLPLVFRLRELRPSIDRGRSNEPQSVAYEALSAWSDSGLYLPDDMVDRIDDRWLDGLCQPRLSAEAARSKWELLAPNYVSISIEAPEPAEAPEVASEFVTRPCRTCRQPDEEGDDDYDDDDKKDWP